ncbi:MAG: S8 family serine peptidase, partial [Elusimicrobiales bacterium]|nr:S8 family serine peptidase [Elusimicrobiales bacterium]
SYGYDKIERIYKNFYSAYNKYKVSYNSIKSSSFLNNINIYPNRVIKPFYIPSDQYFKSQYYLYKIKAPQAWDFEVYNTAISLALIDSGIDPTNPDFYEILYATQVVIKEDCNVISSWEEYFPNFQQSNPNGFPHGTAVAGVAAAVRNNNFGISGIAKMKIYSFDVFRGFCDGDGFLTEKGLVKALEFVKDRFSSIPGKVIINMSLGAMGECSPLVSSIINELYNYDSGKKFILVAATGNDGIEYVAMPANCSGVVSVGATNEVDEVASFSCYGNVMKINGLTAPGVNIFTTLPGSNWSNFYNEGIISGTSFAAPIVSGVMGAVWAKRPNYTNSQIIDIVKKTARDINEDGPDKKYGWGIVDMYKALSYLEADLTEKGINDDLVAWPNPFYISKHGYIKFSIKNSILYPDDKLMIFDFSGAFVAWAEKDSTKGFLWDGKNSAGYYVAPGAYIAYYKSEKGTAKTKFVLFR